MKELLQKKYERFELSERFAQAFGRPETTGVWFIWANGGNGKTTFALQLAEELTNHGRVLYNSLEEGTKSTMQETAIRANFKPRKGRFLLTCEPIEELDERLSKKKAPRIAFIDSFQFTDLSYVQYLDFVNRHTDKLIIFTSHADGKQPDGRPAKKVKYHADLRIWIEGFCAYSHGRFIGPTGRYVIWQEGFEKFYGLNKQQ